MKILLIFPFLLLVNYVVSWVHSKKLLTRFELALAYALGSGMVFAIFYDSYLLSGSKTFIFYIISAEFYLRYVIAVQRGKPDNPWLFNLLVYSLEITAFVAFYRGSLL